MSISSRRALTSCANPLLNILWCLSSFLKTTYSDFALRRFFLLLESCPAHSSRIPCGSQLAASLQKEVQELVENRWISQVFLKDSIEKLFLGFRKPLFSNISALSPKKTLTPRCPSPHQILASWAHFFFFSCPGRIHFPPCYLPQPYFFHLPLGLPNVSTRVSYLPGLIIQKQIAHI